MINKNKQDSLYLQLKKLILNRINNDIYKSGDMIPSEKMFENQFNISRITVRRAIMELQKEGYLTKKQGKGTFVKTSCPNKVEQDLNKISTWTETMKEKGCNPGTSKIEVCKVIPPSEIMLKLNIDKNNMATKIYRIRTGDGVPFCLMTNYILSYLVPGLTVHTIEDSKYESLYKLYEEKYNIQFGRAVENIEARKANDEEIELLNIEKETPVLIITRIAFDPNDNPFEVVKQITRADRYKYSVTLKGR